MASIHEQSGRWYCAFTIYDANTGENNRVFRSTGTYFKKQAQEICNVWGKAARLARRGQLSKSKVDELLKAAIKDVCEADEKHKIGADNARKLLQRGIDDIYQKANLESLERLTVRQWMQRWLERQEIRTARSTHDRYERIIDRFLDFLGDKSGERDLQTLNDEDVERFHSREAKELSAATADLSLKVVRIALGSAVKKRLLPLNPAASVEVIGGNSESKRRPFTLDEIKRILGACGDDQEWRGLVLFGLYIGQRLGDLARLTWRSINLETGEIAFTAGKTGRRIVLPLVQPLIDYLSELPSSDDPDAFIFPRVGSAKRTSSLSNQFRDILVEAGLVEPRGHEKTKQGRNQARETSEISFHSLRHSAVTMLKAAGVSDFIAREIIGHESAAVSRQYTHLSTQDKRAAMQRLPDITKDLTPKKTTRRTQNK